jgi:hypothetical protein
MFSVFQQESHSQQVEQSLLVLLYLLVGAYEHEFLEHYELFESTVS